ncbi:MAG: CHRD domain-containing protein [Myxococcaceae bacterium]
MSLRIAAVVAAAVCLVGCGEKVETTLSGDQQVPAVTTSATGTATAELYGETLEVEGSFEGLQSDLLVAAGSSAHVHRAARGASGPIVFNLTVTPAADNRSGTFKGSSTLSADDLENYRNGLLYVNVHSTDHPTGEIRGQIEPKP